jgi:hypothetical protein
VRLDVSHTQSSRSSVAPLIARVPARVPALARARGHLAWVEVVKAVALLWIVWNHLAERLFGFPFAGTPSGWRSSARSPDTAGSTSR